MEKKRNDLPKSHLIASAISAVAGFSALILAILVLLGAGDWVIYLAALLLGVTQVCQTYLNWEDKPKAAYVSLAAAIVIFGATLVMAFLP